MTAKLFLSNSLWLGPMTLANAETVAIWPHMLLARFQNHQLCVWPLSLSTWIKAPRGQRVLPTLFPAVSQGPGTSLLKEGHMLSMVRKVLQKPDTEKLYLMPSLFHGRERDVQMPAFWPSAGVTLEAAHKPPSCSTSLSLPKCLLLTWTGELGCLLPLHSAPPC